MKADDPIRTPPRLRLIGAAAMAATVLSATPVPTTAAPGAHGPNGEHLDQKSAAVAASTLPRLEAKSELFELVAQLRGGELTVLVDRYETNEPVLGAELTVESGSVKVAAAFRADDGDYVVTDAALLKALTTPGEHALVFTLIAGAETDLLDGTLAARAADAHGPADRQGHVHASRRVILLGGAVTALSVAGSAIWWLRRRRAGTGVVALKGMSS